MPDMKTFNKASQLSVIDEEAEHAPRADSLAAPVSAGGSTNQRRPSRPVRSSSVPLDKDVADDSRPVLETSTNRVPPRKAFQFTQSEYLACCSVSCNSSILIKLGVKLSKW